MSSSSPEFFFNHARQWISLGIKTTLMRVDKEYGIKKLISKGIKLEEPLLSQPEKIPFDFNFLGIFLRDSGLLCLDIEGVPGSVEEFLELLSKRGIDSKTLIMENTLNQGLHLYFQIGEMQIHTQHYKKLGGIHYDILTDMRAFTAPSYLADKKYAWRGRGISHLTSVSDFPTFPSELLDFLDI
jgi:hypothetical protein